MGLSPRGLPENPRGHRYAFEFRDHTWFGKEVNALPAAHRAAFCIYELGGAQSPAVVTTDFVYVRLHGPGKPYQGRYDSRALRGWARRFTAWRREGRGVFCSFDNDQRGHAAIDAQRLRRMI